MGLMLKLKLHRMLGASVKLFLYKMGYKSIWNGVDSNFDELIVLPPITKFIRSVKTEIDKTEFIPFHYSMKFNPEGKFVESIELESGVKKISFIGEIKEVKTFENISGDFHLLRYEDEQGNNYLNKRYKLDNEIIYGKVEVSCRPVAQLLGLRGEKVNLVNWARVKSI